MLGVLGCQTGHLPAGIDLIRQALAIEPGNADFHNNLGMALLDSKRSSEARDAFASAIKCRPRFAAAQFNLANLLREAGEHDDAERHYRKALRAEPEFTDALNNLGNLLRESGKAQEATALFRKLTRIKPEFPFGHFNLGLALQAQQDYIGAVAAFERAIELDSGQVQFWDALGSCQRMRGALLEAREAYVRALDMDSEDPQRLVALGMIHYALNEVDEAHGQFSRAAKLAPHSGRVANFLGMAQSALGRREEAAAQFNRAISLEPKFGDAYRNLASLGGHPEEYEAQAARILAAIADTPADTDRADMSFALGEIYDKLGKFDVAFEYFDAANAVRKAQVKFDRVRQSDYIESIIKVFSSDYFAGLEGQGSNSRRPIFVIGMPRSGTTLVEQILSSHSDVYGAGELTFFPERIPTLPRMLESALPFPQCMPGNEARIQALAPLYLDRLAEIDDRTPYVIDKMPYNFLFLGVIAVLFPRAHVIHCARHPMATCFSIFAHDLAGSHPYSFDLEDLAAAYRGYERLMKHWREVLPIEMLDVKYEALTENTESVSREMLSFLDLSWQGACLDFHRNERSVVTASQWQVRQPIYTSSRDRWRNYAQHLGPLRVALAPGGVLGNAGN